MKLLTRLFGWSRQSVAESDDSGVYIYVQCSGTGRKPCGEALRVRINTNCDLEEVYAEGDEDLIKGYTCHKDVLGTRCQRMLHITVNYDALRHEVDRAVDGGAFIAPDDWLRLQGQLDPSGQRLP